MATVTLQDIAADFKAFDWNTDVKLPRSEQVKLDAALAMARGQDTDLPCSIVFDSTPKGAARLATALTVELTERGTCGGGYTTDLWTFNLIALILGNPGLVKTSYEGNVLRLGNGVAWTGKGSD